MERPNYVLKTNEAVLVPKSNKNAAHGIKIVVWIIIGIILISSLIFQDNIFSELSWSARFLLIALVIGTLFIGESRVDTPSPIELQFYDEYLVVFRPKRYYSKKVTRMEYEKMYYKDISKCLYKVQVQRMHFYGTVDAKWHNYGSDGNPSTVPTYDRIVKNALIYISTKCAEDVDFVSEVQEHSPIRVTLEN